MNVNWLCRDVFAVALVGVCCSLCLKFLIDGPCASSRSTTAPKNHAMKFQWWADWWAVWGLVPPLEALGFQRSAAICLHCNVLPPDAWVPSGGGSRARRPLSARPYLVPLLLSTSPEKPPLPFPPATSSLSRRRVVFILLSFRFRTVDSNFPYRHSFILTKIPEPNFQLRPLSLSVHSTPTATKALLTL